MDYCKANGINESAEDEKSVSEVNEIAGCGLCVLYNGKKLLCGNEKLMKKENVIVPQEMSSKVTVGTSIFVAYDGKFCGLILVADEVKEKSAETISKLKKMGIQENVMLTGDKKEVAQIVAKDIGLDSFYAELFPEDKVDVVEEKLASLENASSDTKNKSRGQLVFCGDGINDAPVLTRADIGISMGSLGSDAAIEASDVVIMDDDISKVPFSIEIARQTRKIATENIVLALGVKIGVLGFASFGLANMWLAIFADVGVCVLATVNAIRAGKIRSGRIGKSSAACGDKTNAF